MKILIVSPYFHPESFKINDLVSELLSRGHSLTVLTGQPNYPGGKIFDGYSNCTKWSDSYKGARLIRVPIFTRGRGGFLRLIFCYLSFVLSASLFGIPRLMFHQFDVSFVFATSPITSALPALLYKLLTCTPVAIWIQDLWPEAVASVGAVRPGLLYRAIGRLVEFIYKYSDLLLIQSNSFRESALKWGAKAEQLKFLPNWAEDQFLDVKNLSLNSGSEFFKILFAGNIGRAQDIETIVAAATHTKSNSKIQWHIYGDGVLSDWLVRQIRDKNLEQTVFYHGRKSLEEMPAIYSAHDAFLVTLKKDPGLSTVMPSKIQSYLAFGRPILAAADGEAADVVARANAGLICGAGDSKALANNAEMLSRYSVGEMARLSVNAQKYYKNEFSKNNVIGNLEQYLSEAIGSKS